MAKPSRYTRAQFEKVLTLSAQGLGRRAIGREAEVGEATVRYWVAGLVPERFADDPLPEKPRPEKPKPKPEPPPPRLDENGQPIESNFQRRKRHMREKHALKIEQAEAQACRTRCVYCPWHFDGPMGLGKAALDQHRREGCSDDYPAPKGKPPQIVKLGALPDWSFDIGGAATPGDPGEPRDTVAAVA